MGLARTGPVVVSHGGAAGDAGGDVPLAAPAAGPTRNGFT